MSRLSWPCRASASEPPYEFGIPSHWPYNLKLFEASTSCTSLHAVATRLHAFAAEVLRSAYLELMCISVL